MFQAIQRQPTMTNDVRYSHKKSITTECVTPNVPKIRSSFFNRKYRDLSGSSKNSNATPPTPKVNTHRSKQSSSAKSRQRRSGGSNNSGSSRQQKYSPRTSDRPSRSRPSNDEVHDLGFSTPRATRSLLTPSTTSNKVCKNGPITHFIYRPLELDNDSSSESMESRYSKRQKQLMLEDNESVSTFIPGNCNIQEMLKMFGKNSNSSKNISIVEKKAIEGDNKESK